MDKQEILYHEELREGFEWGTFGKYGDKELIFVKMTEMSDSHIMHVYGHLILNGCGDLPVTRNFYNEILYRTKNNIFEA